MPSASQPERAPIFQRFRAVGGVQQMIALLLEMDDNELDALEQTAAEAIAASNPESADEAAAMQQRLESLRELRQQDREALQQAYTQYQLSDTLIAWIQTPDWEESESYLRERTDQLLSDEAEAALALLAENNPDAQSIPLHQNLLAGCRAQGIDAAYEQLRQELRLRQMAQTPVGQQVIAFIQADDAQAERLLTAPESLLLSADGRRHLQAFLEAAQQQGDEETAARLAARLALWDEARFGSQAGATANPVQGLAPVTEPRLQPLGTQSTALQEGYLIVSPHNCAIGDNAITINNFGRIPLAWRRPEEFQRDLTENAVGRRQELQDLHAQLQRAGRGAVVGRGRRRGASGAIEGIPGIGKSTLAAMYAEAYAHDYPGGVLWLQLTPDMLTAESVGPEISRMAVYAYSADVQAYQLFGPQPGNAGSVLENALFQPRVVRALLASHSQGRLLMVADNVWDRRVLDPIRAALPADAHLFVTTRDRRVARDVGNPTELDVLSPADAALLTARFLPHLPSDQSERLALVVDHHPLALEIAAADVAARSDPADWPATIEEIATSIAQGLSVDGAPLDDEIERERRLELVLQHSYDSLGRGGNGAALQSHFRSLGSLAPEADCPAELLAAMWQVEAAQARRVLDVFANRSLIRHQADGRWQQHAILRGYARSRQTAQERLLTGERYAEYYLQAMRQADDAGEYYRMAPELPNLRHAFAWAVEEESLHLTLGLVINCADLLRSQNLGNEYLSWADQVLALARRMGGGRGAGAGVTKPWQCSSGGGDGGDWRGSGGAAA